MFRGILFVAFVHMRKHLRFLLFSATALLPIFSVLGVEGSGNDFVATDWRHDPSDVNQAGGYFTYLAPANYLDPSSTSFTTGWLSVDLAQPIPGVVGSGLFSQVGVMSRNNHLFWFVYAEPGVQCLRGTPFYGNLGCMGVDQDLVRLQQWNAVALYHDYGSSLWFANVLGYTGASADVAAILSNNSQIFDAQVTAEEGYDTATDPFVAFSYYFNHPQYRAPGGNYVDWLGSGGGNVDQLYLTQVYSNQSQTYYCYYGATMALNGDTRSWYAGNGGPTCSYIFP